MSKVLWLQYSLNLLELTLQFNTCYEMTYLVQGREGLGSKYHVDHQLKGKPLREEKEQPGGRPGRVRPGRGQQSPEWVEVVYFIPEGKDGRT